MKNFAQFRPNTFLVYPRRNCLRLEFFDHFVFCIFSNFELKCLDFAPEIKKSLSTLLSNCLEEKFDYHVFREVLLFYLMSDFDQKIVLLSTLIFR